MSCSNCFNGCTEIISDQCVRYTGFNIPALGISNGDTLASVELQITTFIIDLSTGNGIIPVINPADLCSLVSSFLPVSGDITLNDVISALIRSICALKTSVTAIESTLTTLNANYTIGCLTGVTASSDTHDILQAAINKLCSTATDLTVLAANVNTNYVKLADLNALIQAYLNSIAPSNLYKNKMVPYVAYEYYGSLAGFDVTGAGSGLFIDVFLCNGSNATPDKRGRVAVGTTDGTMAGTITMSAIVNPSTAGNPSYSINGLAGANNVTLTTNQIPVHTHTATGTSTSTATPHSHFIAKDSTSNSGDLSPALPLLSEWDGASNFSYRLKQTTGSADEGPTSNTTVVVNTSTSVVVDAAGGGLSHNNIQPTIGAYYIMYIP
jgi:microcystin-dependent protein